MNQAKTGQFIKSVRTEKALTQREIAEALNISEKTVSKWETGKGLPEVSLMLPLCKILDINVNELLSGERLNERQYVEKAEENILSLTADKISPRKKVTITSISCILTVLSVLAIILIAGFIDIPVWLRILMIGISIIIVLSHIVVILLVAVSVEAFECENCGNIFVPTLSAYLMGAHTFKRRRLKCPHCGKRRWDKSKIKK